MRIREFDSRSPSGVDSFISTLDRVFAAKTLIS